MLGFLYESILRPQLDVLKSIGGGTNAGRKIARVVGGKDRPEGQNDVQMKVGSRPPIGFERRANRVSFDRGSVSSAKQVDLVMAKVNGIRIVGLKWRPCPQRGGYQCKQD